MDMVEVGEGLDGIDPADGVERAADLWTPGLDPVVDPASGERWHRSLFGRRQKLGRFPAGSPAAPVTGQVH